jgi:ABC-type sugar transport system ATPase subunit
MLRNVSFTLRKGEVLGFAGLVGAGRTEVMRAIFGVDPILSGEIYVKGSKVEFRSPKDAIKSGIALCPEDRKEEGLVLQQSIKCNVSMPVLSKITRHLLIDMKREAELADDAVGGFSIKTPTVDKKTLELSGGNQQKVILGRWTSKMLETDILMLDEPTKGIDVGTKAEIYQMVCNFAMEGKGVIFISSELTEVLNVSDNIIVMHNGHITGRLTRQEATEEGVLALAMMD